MLITLWDSTPSIIQHFISRGAVADGVKSHRRKGREEPRSPAWNAVFWNVLGKIKTGLIIWTVPRWWKLHHPQNLNSWNRFQTLSANILQFYFIKKYLLNKKRDLLSLQALKQYCRKGLGHKEGLQAKHRPLPPSASGVSLNAVKPLLYKYCFHVPPTELSSRPGDPPCGPQSLKDLLSGHSIF